MGHGFDARCRQCEKVFKVQEGGGFNFTLLHCEVCGKAKARARLEKIDPEVEHTWGTCECGGELTYEASPRCPKCRSAEFEPVPGTEILYD